MTGPVDYYAYDWAPLHGDSDTTPTVAILGGPRSDQPVDLAGWSLRAQVRDRSGALVHEFVRGVGIETGEGEVRLDGVDEPVRTSTVRLRLRREDWAPISRKLRGAAYDVEVYRGSIGRTVLGGSFEPVEDVTRD